LPVKYYTAFGLNGRAVDLFLDVENPKATDIVAAQIRPYDGGINPLFSAFGSVDPICDITWVLRANQEAYHPTKITPSTVAVIRSRQLRTILDGTPYLGNRIYLASLNNPPLIHSDLAKLASAWIRDDISGDYLYPYIRDFLPCIIETFAPAEMTKLFIQQDATLNYGASAVRDWVDDGNVFLNFFGNSRPYNGGGEAMSSIGLVPGDLIRTKKDDNCLRPLDATVPTEYTLTTGVTAYYWSTLPTQAGWTTRTLMAYVHLGVEYPFFIEMEHVASGGHLISLCLRDSYCCRLPGWYYPILFFQYALGKAGYLGAVPAYQMET